MIRNLEVEELRRQISAKPLEYKGDAAFIGQERFLEGVNTALALGRIGTDDINPYNCYVGNYDLQEGEEDPLEMLVKDFAKDGETPPDQLLVSGFGKDPDRLQRKILFEAGQGRLFVKEYKKVLDQATLGRDRARERVIEEAVGIYKPELINYLQECNRKIQAVGLSINEKEIPNIAEKCIEAGGGIDQFMAVHVDAVDEPSNDAEAQAFAQEVITRPEFMEAMQELYDRAEKIFNKVRSRVRQLITGESDLITKKLRSLYKRFQDKEIYPDGESILKEYLRDVEETLPHSQKALTQYRKIRQELEEKGMAKTDQATLETLKLLSARYEVNHIVRNDADAGQPVVKLQRYDYEELFGTAHTAEVSESSQVQVSTRPPLHTEYKAGAFVQANGGYLLLDTEKLVRSYLFPEVLQALEESEVEVNSHGNISILIGSKNRSVPLQADTRVVLCGSSVWELILRRYVPKFDELFKSSARYENKLPAEDQVLRQKAQQVISIAQEACPQKMITPEGVNALLEEGLREANDRKKVVTSKGFYRDLILRSAVEAQGDRISAADVYAAIQKKRYIEGGIEDSLSEHIQRGISKIDFTGRKVGQINGLAILGSLGFGVPSKFTVQVYAGGGNFRDVEEASKLGGKIHVKSTETIESLVKGEFNKKGWPFPFSVALASEQSYGGIDGDSATLGRYVALVSAITEIPVKQNGAITGSANQYGEAQVVGEVNKKIEGHYRECERFTDGFKDMQGEDHFFVVLPNSNVDNLMLDQKVIGSVEAGDYKVYTVDSAHEACEVMLGVEWEEIEKKLEEKVEAALEISRKKSLKKKKKGKGKKNGKKS